MLAIVHDPRGVALLIVVCLACVGLYLFKRWDERPK